MTLIKYSEIVDKLRECLRESLVNSGRFVSLIYVPAINDLYIHYGNIPNEAYYGDYIAVHTFYQKEWKIDGEREFRIMLINKFFETLSRNRFFTIGDLYAQCADDFIELIVSRFNEDHIIENFKENLPDCIRVISE